MGISVGSYEDLEPEGPQPVDRNPLVDCHGDCGERYQWKQWQEWYDFTPETAFVCPDCRERRDRRHRRRENNQRLSGFGSGSEREADDA